MRPTLMNRKERLYRIVGRLSHPSIPEIQSFIRLNLGEPVCRGLQDVSYQNILYYLMELEGVGRIVSLFCSSGYKRRFCLNFSEHVLKNRLHSLVKYNGRTLNSYEYTIGRRRIKLEIPPTDLCEQDDQDLNVFYDRNIGRFYFTCGTLFVAVVQISNLESPRLPSSTYGYGTEYERCHKMLQKTQFGGRTLGVKGRQKLTG